MALPLSLRLPNGPAAFVGRAREVQWLQQAVERAPVTLVCGAGGVGKSALALHVLHQHLRERTERAVYIDVRPGEAPDQLRLNLLSALTKASGGTAPEVFDPEEVVASAIDCAEEGGWLVFVDDVHHTDRSEADELLTQIASYARRSRWVFTSRLNPGLDLLSAQTLDLDGMQQGDLARLLAEWGHDPAESDARQALLRSGGSPWLMMQLLSGCEEASLLTRAGVLGNFSDVAREFVAALSVLRDPIDIASASAFARVPDDGELERLERHGLIVMSRGGVRLHDVLRPLYDDAPEKAQWALRAAESLAASKDALSRLEALRLFLTQGDEERAASLLATAGQDILTGGYAPRLFRTLDGVALKKFKHWRLRCAAAMGNPTALGSVGEPPSPNPSDLLAWSRALFAQGRLAETREYLAKTKELAGDLSDAERAKARLLDMRCAVRLGEGHLPPPPDSIAGAALAFWASARSGQRDAPPSFGADAPVEALLDVAEGLWIQGRGRESAEWVRRASLQADALHLYLRVGREHTVLVGRLAVDAGDLTTARAAIDSLAPYMRGPSIVRPSFHELCCEWALSAGDVALAEDSLRAGFDEAMGMDHATARRLAALGAEVAHLVGAESPGDLPGQLWWAERRGGAAAAADDTSYWGLRRLSQAALHTAPRDALSHARRTLQVAQRGGKRREEACAWMDVADAGIVLADADATMEAAAALAALGRETHSPRFATLASFYGSLSDPAGMERLAAQEASPIAQRRAQALLGHERTDMDAVDRLVVERGRRWNTRTLCATPTWSPAWTLHATENWVRLPAGDQVPLARKKQLWSLLTALTATGFANKEELVLALWSVPRYHPLKHDPKLQVAVRSLRMALEEDPSAPALICTVEDGYQLKAPVRIIQPL